MAIAVAQMDVALLGKNDSFYDKNDWLQLRIDMFIWFPVLVLA